MKKSSYLRGLASAGIIALASILNPVSAKSQQNTIYSRNPELSAAGEGVILKDHVFNYQLVPNTVINLENEFGLYATRGEVNYSASDARAGLENVISYLRGNISVVRTDIGLASIDYFENLLSETTESDRASVAQLNRALEDRVIDVQGDSLYVDGNWRIQEGRYGIIARSNAVPGFSDQSIPILVEFTYAPEQAAQQPAQVQPIVPVQPEPIPADTTATPVIPEPTPVPAEPIPQPQIPAERQTTQADLERGIKYGIEAGVGATKEATIGAFFEYPVTSWMALEGFGNFYAARGNPVTSDEDTEVTMREKKLVGPFTYKTREDRITSYSDGRAIFDSGIGVTFRVNDFGIDEVENFEFPFRAGPALVKNDNWKYGESTIRFERNQKTLEENTISNTETLDSNFKKVLSLSGGVRYNIDEFSVAGINVEGLSLGYSFNRVGDENSIRVNIRYNLR